MWMIMFKTYAQSYIIKGTVQDSTQHAIEYAEATLFKNDSGAVQSTLTDSTGHFVLTATKGSYILQIRQIGVIFYKQAIELVQNTNVGIILTATNIKQLGGVTVTSRKPIIERKVDRLVFNVENTIAVNGSDALDALKVTPGLRVQNDAVSLIGKSGVKIMIDDRLIVLSGDQLTSFLKSIPGGNISKIEVMTNPPSNYDAAGNSGIINIITKKMKSNGYNGAITVGYTQATYPSYTTGANFNYKNKKMSIYGLLNFTDGKTAPDYEQSVFYTFQTWNQKEKKQQSQNTFTGLLGADFNLDSNSVIGVEYSGNYYKSAVNSKSNMNVLNTYNNMLDSSIAGISRFDNSAPNNSLNIHYRKRLNGNKKFSIDADFLNQNSNKRANFRFETLNADNNPTNLPTQIFKTEAQQNIKLYTVKSDLELPFKNYDLSFGVKGSWINTINNIEFYNYFNNQYKIDLSKTDEFNYKEDIYAIYGNISKTFSNLELKMGLRTEFTSISGQSLSMTTFSKSDYINLFPTVFAMYKLGEKNIFNLNYSKRINRPGYSLLNPFRSYKTNSIYVEGNPSLRPSYNHNFELSYNYNNFLTNTISYLRINNDFEQFTFLQNNTDTQYTFPLNFLKVNKYQYTCAINVTKRIWETYTSAGVYYSKSLSSIPEAEKVTKGWGSFFLTQNQFYLNKKKKYSCFGNFWIQFPETDQIDKSNCYYNLDIGMKYSLFENRLQLIITATDLLKSNKAVWTSYSNSIKHQFSNYYDSRRFRITLKYSFGNSKINIKRQETSNTDEKNRMN